MFEPEELFSAAASLDLLSEEERVQFRDKNALDIAQSPSSKTLIISGPGTGKSTLFKKRIDHWLREDPLGRVLALSFVKKLVIDLQSDIEGDSSLSDEQKSKVSVLTLHGYARSIVERNHGTVRLRFRPHLKIIDSDWQEVVWTDALLVSGFREEDYPWKKFEKQLHDSGFLPSEDWKTLRGNYYAICKYYNAAGFADLIIHARVALSENTNLDEHEYFIVDEFQDFNQAEEMLIRELISKATGTLLVGDDDQVLYEKIKSGKASIIRQAYKDESLANAMLPFGSRGSFHIAKTAAHFIQHADESERIEKIYLPLSTDASTQKVQIISCPNPQTSVDYIAKFIEEHREELELRKKALTERKAKDPFLLILARSKELKFYAAKDPSKDARLTLLSMISEFGKEERKFSSDYYKLLTYYSLAKHPDNNYVFRKVLSYETTAETILPLLKLGLETEVGFSQMIEKKVIIQTLEKSRRIEAVMESDSPTAEKVKKIEAEISLENPQTLIEDLERQAVSEASMQSAELEEDERAELEEQKAAQMSAIELMSIVGSKGLSADHVIVLGFDDVNMRGTTRNAFYVAMTRARKSLHLLTTSGAGGAQKPHDFVDELPTDHVDFHKYLKSKRELTPLADRENFKRYFRSLNYAKSINRKKK